MTDTRALVPVEAQILDELRDLVAERTATRTRRRRRAVRRFAVAAVAAVAVAAALLSRGSSPLAPAPASAASVLTAAAEAAAAAPATEGTYWRLATRSRFGNASGTGLRTLTETQWQDRHGRRWIADDGQPPVAMLPPYGFDLCQIQVRYRQLTTLPVDPSALRARLATFLARDRDVVVDPEVGVADCLVQLLAWVPVPPAVRAAAWQALATGQGTDNRGETTDRAGRRGVGLHFTDLGTVTDLVVDPSTGALLEYDQAAPHRVVSYLTILSAGWTDAAPTG